MALRRHARLIGAVALAAALAALACEDAEPPPSAPIAATASPTPTAAATAPPAATATAATPSPTPAATPAPTSTPTPSPTPTPEPLPLCERDEGVLTAEAAVEGSWAARCRSDTLDAVAEGGSMFHVFTVPARGMVTIALDAAGEAELVLRRGEAREGAALEEDAARIRLPLDAGAYTVEVADRAGAGGAYTLTLGLVEPPAMSYLTFDATGETVTAGSYAILTGEPGARRAVTTYEELRTEASAVRFHLADAGGTSHADFLATVEVGDVFEWRQADDCWARYQVTTLPEASDGGPYVEFGVRWVTYAYSGCSGPLPGALPGALGWHPVHVGGTSLASPMRHGAHHLAPAGWTGLIEARGTYPPPSVLAYQAEHETTEWPLSNPKPVTTTDIAEARTFPEWREPTLPTGWTLFEAETDTPTAMPDGYCAHYLNESGYMGAMICGGYKVHRPEHYASILRGAVVRETRMIGGFTALVSYSPPGPAHERTYGTWVEIFDDSTGVAYFVMGSDWTLMGSRVDATIAIARSLFRE